MKTKKLYHPKYYLRIINRKINMVEVEFQDNEFADDGKRKIKRCDIDCKNNMNILSNDSLGLLDILNEKELQKTINYIETQKKVLKYHISKNQHDLIRTVRDSIEIMKEFRMNFKNNEL